MFRPMSCMQSLLVPWKHFLDGGTFLDLELAQFISPAIETNERENKKGGLGSKIGSKMGKCAPHFLHCLVTNDQRQCLFSAFTVFSSSSAISLSTIKTRKEASTNLK